MGVVALQSKVRLRKSHADGGFKQLRRFMLSGLLAMSLLFLAAACGSEPAAPTPTPEPELSLDELLASAAAKLAAMSTAKFRMIDEKQTGQKFFGTTVKTVEGDVRSPDSTRIVVDVEAPGMGFVEIEIVAIQDQAFMKFSRDAPWLPLPLEQVPFRFGRIGIALSELLVTMRDAAIVGPETLGNYATVRVDGNVLSEDMSGLIASVDPGHAITLSYWFDETDQTLRQFRIDGQLFNQDAPETSRRVNMQFEVPVDIQLPQVASGP